MEGHSGIFLWVLITLSSNLPGFRLGHVSCSTEAPLTPSGDVCNYGRKFAEHEKKKLHRC